MKTDLTIDELKKLDALLLGARDLVIMCRAYKEIKLTGSPHLTLMALQEIAGAIGCEIVERRPFNEVLDQMAGKTTAADEVAVPKGMGFR